MTNERMRILKMVAEGTLTPEQGDELLAALDDNAQQTVEIEMDKQSAQAQPRWFRVQVTDARTGKTRVNVRIPLKLVRLGAQLSARFVPEIKGVPLDDLLRSLTDEQVGRIVEVDDEESGERVVVEIV
nr:hypothetical protein [Ardenticatena sp.]